MPKKLKLKGRRSHRYDSYNSSSRRETNKRKRAERHRKKVEKKVDKIVARIKAGKPVHKRHLLKYKNLTK